MSTDNKNNAQKSSSFSIVRKIASFLKLGDEGKLQSFFTRGIKKFNKEITAHQKNLGNLKFNYEQELDTLKDKLEDAQTVMVEATMKVDVISTNADQDAFFEIYVDNLDRCSLEITSIEKGIAKLKENYKIAVEDTEKQIKSIQARIDMIMSA